MNTAEASAQSLKDTKLEDFDLVILGGGTGSTIAAWTFAKQGQRVAVVDRKYIGGSCPNIACLPSKNIIHSAKLRPTFAAAKISASPTNSSPSIWPKSVTANAKWSPD